MSIMQPTEDTIRRAAEIIRSGGVVVMPTETVYGLACNALDVSAVRKVFEIKNRPAGNPLIVHVAGLESLGLVAASWPAMAEKLALRFWPGPLTMVLPRRDCLPLETTAGLSTVAVRAPDHPVAQALIKAAGVPLAAPSANPFSELSPTSADDVDPQIAQAVPMILDGGPCVVGLESTVLDFSSDMPHVLRPGGLPRSLIQATIGVPLGESPPDSVRRSPGQYQRHYAPKTRVVLVDRLAEDQPGLTLAPPANENQILMPSDPSRYASALYSCLRRLDSGQFDEVYVMRPPLTPEWEAIHDRLGKASSV